MNLKLCIDWLEKRGGTLTGFAARAGMSLMYLRHILAGRKRNPTLETVVRLVVASDGEIPLASLRPDLFAGKSGNKTLELVRKSASVSREK